MRWSLALSALVLVAACARAHTIDLDAGVKECFFEDLHTEDKMTVTYQVAGGGHLDIDFSLTGPGGRIMNEQRKKDTGTHSFTAESDGRYTYCFSNEMSTVSGKTVSFNVHGIMYVEDDGHTAPIEREIRQLSAALEAVKDEQEYIVVRERLHRDTAESTNDRVKYWSIVQTVMLFAVCGWQVFYLKRFFEVKRSV
ncbi:emp24/gp25L/p24 family/GOLD-domain-containing protein [Rhodotorula diobovata]|uniref:Emp24/gp25L/p24 family/GOLD-domain-containing protein n=1 Tax=Rhodotorula diobovata TaxID=5288 RepID=A0A5C5FXV6_9BASI|nr:emp24/gp25L/p24 family/GOLD-domain-containing protein [Rhodotorula diobovata]